MKRERCSMEPLVEARRDGRLSEREDASLTRHLATCPSCAALAEDLARITTLLRAPGRGASPLVRQRGRVRLLRDAAHRPERRSRPVWLAGAAALALLAFSLLLRSPSPSPPLASIAPPAPLSSTRTMTELQPDEGARFTRSASGGLTVVTLEDGGVTFRVRAQEPEERFLVKTADAEVEVRGTVFRVEAKATRIRAVLVEEGKVLVRFRGETTFVEGGESWRPPPEPPQNETASATTSPAVSAPPPPPPAAVKTRESAPPPREATTKPATEGATKDFADGVRMIERGDYGAAADKLEAFSSAHPKDSSAEDAAFLAILALQRAGRLSEAAAAAKRYLDRYPQGYRRAEAEQIVAGTAQR